MICLFDDLVEMSRRQSDVQVQSTEREFKTEGKNWEVISKRYNLKPEIGQDNPGHRCRWKLEEG